MSFVQSFLQWSQILSTKFTKDTKFFVNFVNFVGKRQTYARTR